MSGGDAFGLLLLFLVLVLIVQAIHWVRLRRARKRPTRGYVVQRPPDPMLKEVQDIRKAVGMLGLLFMLLLLFVGCGLVEVHGLVTVLSQPR